jgi:bifunctional non-homologous end joining protein LigD
MLATQGVLPAEAVEDRYGFEMKWDGVRALVVVGRSGPARLYSRTGRDMAVAYPELGGLADAVRACAGAGEAVLDGEIVAFDPGGRVSFSALQPRMHVSNVSAARRLAADNPCVWLGFDVLRLGGADRTGLAYTERRDLLDSLALAGPCWQVPPYLTGSGADALALSEAQHLEGVVAKLRTSRYEPGRRSPAWIKVKHVCTQAVVVGGWRPGRGGLAGGLGSLLVGLPGEAGLVYAGRVGTGLTVPARSELLDRLQRIGSAVNPFGTTVPRADAGDAQWVRPVLVGEVAFTEWTRDGRLRAPVWRGLRPDVDPGSIVREG